MIKSGRISLHLTIFNDCLQTGTSVLIEMITSLFSVNVDFTNADEDERQKTGDTVHYLKCRV